jgi:glutamate-1-semialdehyde 2,1-aminomutase
VTTSTTTPIASRTTESSTITIDRDRLSRLADREVARFVADHPKSKALFERAKASMLSGVPMHWMARWAGGFPVFLASAAGAHFTDIDDSEYIDLCLGDTGAMTGHSPAPVVQAIADQARRGITSMLPTEDALWVAEELTRRFGLSHWQFCLTATDANRFSIRLARAVTGRRYVLVFNGCYHGTVDETFIALENGHAVSRQGNIGPPVLPIETTKVVEFNDLAALEAALAPGDVACVLAEPVMTNVGIVQPDPGYHAALRELTSRTGTLLIIDETHTICAGPSGYTGLHGLQPDMFVIGKPIASGLPAAAYGFTSEIAERIITLIERDASDTGGIGGTLAGNALSLAAMRATLEHVLTEVAFKRMIALGERFATGVEQAINAARLPWHVARLGCRAEYAFRANAPRNGGEALASADPPLDQFMHLYALNRGILLTPFHMMALMSPATTEVDVDAHTGVFESAVRELTAT